MLECTKLHYSFKIILLDEYFYMNTLEMQTKFLLYCVVLLLELSFLGQMNGQVIDEYGKLQY